MHRGSGGVIIHKAFRGSDSSPEAVKSYTITRKLVIEKCIKCQFTLQIWGLFGEDTFPPSLKIQTPSLPWLVHSLGVCPCPGMKYCILIVRLQYDAKLCIQLKMRNIASFGAKNLNLRMKRLLSKFIFRHVPGLYYLG